MNDSLPSFGPSKLTQSEIVKQIADDIDRVLQEQFIGQQHAESYALQAMIGRKIEMTFEDGTTHMYEITSAECHDGRVTYSMTPELDQVYVEFEIVPEDEA